MEFNDDADYYRIYEYNTELKHNVAIGYTAGGKFSIKGLEYGSSHKFSIRPFVVASKGVNIYSPSYTSINVTIPQASQFARFRKVSFIGDSYTAGYIKLNDGTLKVKNYDQSWVHYLNEMNKSAEYVNCGVSGATTKTWLTHNDGYKAMLSAGKSQAYVIGLMINDGHRASASDPVDKVRVPVGNASEIKKGL